MHTGLQAFGELRFQVRAEPLSKAASSTALSEHGNGASPCSKAAQSPFSSHGALARPALTRFAEDCEPRREPALGGAGPGAGSAPGGSSARSAPRSRWNPGGSPGPGEPHRSLPGAGACYRRRSFSLDIFTAREGTGGIDDSEPRKDKEVIVPYWALINPGSQPPLVLTIPHSHICMRNTIVGLFQHYCILIN